MCSIGACLNFQEFSLLSSWYETRKHAGKYGAEEACESSTARSTDSRKKETLGLAWSFETSSQPETANFLQQGRNC